MIQKSKAGYRAQRTPARSPQRHGLSVSTYDDWRPNEAGPWPQPIPAEASLGDNNEDMQNDIWKYKINEKLNDWKYKYLIYK